MTAEIITAQNQNPALAGEQLIKNRPEDLLLAELITLRNQNLAADRAQKLQNMRIKFSRHYIALANSFFSLDGNQLKTFDLEKRKTLGKLIFNHAKSLAKTQKLLFFLPIIGWLLLPLDNGCRSFRYWRLYKKLVEICGADNYLDNEIMTKAINGDYEPRYSYYD